MTRLKSGIRFYVAESRPVDETMGLRCDPTIRLNSVNARKAYPEPLRRISFVDPENGRALVFRTNQFALPVLLMLKELFVKNDIRIDEVYIPKQVEINNS